MTRDGIDGLRELASARQSALLRFGLLLTGDRHRAEDLVQTALTRTLAAWPRVSRRDDPEGYVRRTMSRLAANERRWRWRETSYDDPPVRDPQEPTGDPELRDLIWAALAGLPARQRAVLVLRYYEDLSEAQIADVLGCSAGTVKSQAARGLDRLRAVTGLTEEEARR